MKGYYVTAGYMGLIGKDEYMLFANEQEYAEYMSEQILLVSIFPRA